MDSLIALLQRDMNELPTDIQGYAKKLIADAGPRCWFAQTQLISELKINEITTTFTNSWPFEFSSGPFASVTQAGFNGHFGLIAAYSMALLPQLTSQFTFYLSEDLLMIFYLDAGGAQIGSFISPGYPDIYGDCGRNIPGSWKHTGEAGDAFVQEPPRESA